MNHQILGIVVLASLCAGVCGCGSDNAQADMPAQMLFVDTKTGQAVIGTAVTEFPAVHPATGKRTLMPGLYCPQCQKWHATPPLEELNRTQGAAVCRKTGAKLTLDGPWPESSPSAPGS